MERRQRKEAFEEEQKLRLPDDVAMISDSEPEFFHLSHLASSPWFMGPESSYLWLSNHVPPVVDSLRDFVEDRSINAEIVKAKGLRDGVQTQGNLRNEGHRLDCLLDVGR